MFPSKSNTLIVDLHIQALFFGPYRKIMFPYLQLSHEKINLICSRTKVQLFHEYFIINNGITRAYSIVLSLLPEGVSRKVLSNWCFYC